MKTRMLVSLAGWLFVMAVNHASAQQKTDSNPTWATVAVLMGTHQRATEETVRKQVVLTLEKIGAPVAQPLARVMEDEFRLAFVNPESERMKHVDSVITAANILGRQGHIIARDEYVTEMLLTFTHEKRKVVGRAEPVDVDRDVRVAAIDALGRIFAQKAVFLVLQSPNELTREKNKEALTAVEYMRTETQDLKKNITLLLTAKAGLDDTKARDLMLATRNLARKFRLYQKLGFIMGELEPPIGKEKDLSTRIVTDMSDMEAKLREVWAPTGGKDDKERDVLRKQAAATAEQRAHDLCDEMDDLVRRVDGWLQMNDRTRKVILSFMDTLRSSRQNHPIIHLCAVEALGRVYGNRD